MRPHVGLCRIKWCGLKWIRYWMKGYWAGGQWTLLLRQAKSSHHCSWLSSEKPNNFSTRPRLFPGIVSRRLWLIYYVNNNQLKWVALSLFSVRCSSGCLATQFFLCTERLARQSWWQQAADIDSCKCTDNNFEHFHSQHPYLADASVKTVLCKKEKVL